MKKVIRIDITKIIDAEKRQIYVYKVASFSTDKVSLEKHFISMLNIFDKSELVSELNKDLYIIFIKMFNPWFKSRLVFIQN